MRELRALDFSHAADLLEDVRIDLGNTLVDMELSEAAEMAVEELPDEVKHASREAFKSSGLHGFAASGMDSHAHHTTAAGLHDKAAALAKKHGLVKLAHQHQKKAIAHNKQARSADVDEAMVGRKAQGHRSEKSWVQRHGHAPKRSYNAAEKAAETKVRQAGKKAARERD